MKNYAEEFRPDLAQFRKATRQFYQGEQNAFQYKAVSGGFGSYAQRGGKAGMLRLRLCGGRISKDTLAFLADCIERYKISRVHLTTCQTVQLHNLGGEAVCSLVEEAWERGIITRGCGGDYPRSVMASPLSGVEQGEYFDVSPCAEAASEYLLGFINRVKLPRKLKVCFSTGPKNFPHATFRDLGFVAKEKGTFDVYAAGGLGSHPKMGVPVAEDVPPEDTLYYIKAMVDTFTSYGDYTNRGKSRSRYMQDALGSEGFRRAFREKLAAARESGCLKIDAAPVAIAKEGCGTIRHPRAIAQKQPGLYAVSCHPAGGSPDPSLFRQLQEAIAPMEAVEIRLAPDQGFYLVNCTAAEAKALIGLTGDGAQTLFETSVACIGNSICQAGARDSQALLSACIQAVRPYRFADGVLPKIHISGCPASCGAHQIGTLGFRGGVKQTPEGPKPAFAVYEGGCELQGCERFGREIGVMLQEDIPKFFIDLGKAVTEEGENYQEWISGNHSQFLEIAGKYF